MTSQLSLQQALRYHRQISLPTVDLAGQEALLSSHVLILGLGGLGCAAAQYLAAAGVGTLTLCDFDSVELSNLQRQTLHQEADIGINKAESAAASLRAVNSELVFHVVSQKLSLPELTEKLVDCDLVLDCSDNLDTRNEVNAACVATSTPLVSGSAIRMEGQVISFKSDGSSPCYSCLSSLFTDDTLTCVEAGILSPVVGIIGSYQALSAIKILADIAPINWGELALFDGQSGRWQYFTVKQQPDCQTCQYNVKDKGT